MFVCAQGGPKPRHGDLYQADGARPGVSAQNGVYTRLHPWPAVYESLVGGLEGTLQVQGGGVMSGVRGCGGQCACNAIVCLIER